MSHYFNYWMNKDFYECGRVDACVEYGKHEIMFACENKWYRYARGHKDIWSGTMSKKTSGKKHQMSHNNRGGNQGRMMSDPILGGSWSLSQNAYFGQETKFP